MFCFVSRCSGRPATPPLRRLGGSSTQDPLARPVAGTGSLAEPVTKLSKKVSLSNRLIIHRGLLPGIEEAGLAMTLLKMVIPRGPTVTGGRKGRPEPPAGSATAEALKRELSYSSP